MFVARIAVWQWWSCLLGRENGRVPEDLCERASSRCRGRRPRQTSRCRSRPRGSPRPSTPLRVEIARLRAQLGSRSMNSSKRPSADRLGKPAPRSLRRKGGKPGGQDVPPGQTLRRVTTPDVIVEHEPGRCSGHAHDHVDRRRAALSPTTAGAGSCAAPRAPAPCNQGEDAWRLGTMAQHDRPVAGASGTIDVQTGVRPDCLRMTESEPMDLRDYVRLLRRRWRLIAVCVLLSLSAAIGATVTATKVYTANAQMFVSAQQPSTDISSAYTGSLFTQQRVKSYVSLISTPRIATLVDTDLQTSRSAVGEISASAPLDTVLIDVSVKDRDPARARDIANSVGRVFPRLVNEIEKPTRGGVSPVRVSVVQQAQLPTAPTSPRPGLNLALGLLVGLALGVGGAVMRETLDTTVKGLEDARELLGAPMLGAISYDSDAARKPLVVVHSPNSVRSEAFRQLRTNLQFVDIEHSLHSVVVTSSVPGEGKTTTTCNLAIMLAQAGLKVILVEGDLRRPRLADYMGIEGAVGLTSVLLGLSPLQDVLQPWGDRNLRVLASGPLPPNPSELLGSHGMQDLLRELEKQADIVVIDAPPLLPVTDAAVLGTLTSGLVMLIRSGSTRREQVARAVSTINAAGATLLGGVLNMVPTRGPDSYEYGYGYGNQPSKGTGRLARDQSPVMRPRRGGGVNAPGLDDVAVAKSHPSVDPLAVTTVKEPPLAPEPPQAPPPDLAPEPPVAPTPDLGYFTTASLVSREQSSISTPPQTP